MKLQEFVSQTLREVIGGVQDAQKYAARAGARINPAVCEAKVEQTPSYTCVDGAGYVPITQIGFDVAVTSTDTTETQAGVGIIVAVLGMGVKDTSDISNTCVSRVRFSVPIAFPRQDG
jgi:hypothetical protein